MPKMQQMHAAIEQWLVARASFHENGSAYLDTYCAADTSLLASFAVDWVPDDPSMFGTAYQHFRAALIADSPPRLAD
jgi:hypothetical protein